MVGVHLLVVGRDRLERLMETAMLWLMQGPL